MDKRIKEMSSCYLFIVDYGPIYVVYSSLHFSYLLQ